MKYFYGPVPSRRLGFSLGVDIVPGKTCSFNCVYCQLGGGMKRLIRRFEWVDIEKFKKQLKIRLEKNSTIDYITISGSGEPTLHKGLDKIISAIKSVTLNRYPVCVITNSSLLYRKDVRKELAGADLIIPSLDSVTGSVFKKINRPHPDVSLKKIINGIASLRKEFKGKIYLEVMLVAGLNDTLEEAIALRKAIEIIRPDKVQLNLPLRPSAEKVKIPSQDVIKKFAAVLSGIKGVEIVKESYPKRKAPVFDKDLCEKIKHLVSIRPETAQAMSKSLRADLNQVKNCLKDLSLKAKIILSRREGKIYYKENDRRKRKKNP